MNAGADELDKVGGSRRYFPRRQPAASPKKGYS